MSGGGKAITVGDEVFVIDPVPRVIAAADWARIEAGLAQRVRALNAFVADVYGERVGQGLPDTEWLSDAGSNSWVGEPQKISSLDNPMKQQLFTPVKNAQDIYATFEVRF